MTELVFILDRSGSMAGLEADTTGGFNSMIAKQKKEAGEALVSTVLFDNESVVIHDRLPLEKGAAHDGEGVFHPWLHWRCWMPWAARSTTLATFTSARREDAGKDNVHHHHRRYKRASRRYSYETVRRMIERQKENTAGNSCFWARTSTRRRKRLVSASAPTGR